MLLKLNIYLLFEVKINSFCLFGVLFIVIVMILIFLFIKGDVVLCNVVFLLLIFFFVRIINFFIV